MTGVPKLGKLESRFRSGSGEKYLRDGITIRCQAVSKTNLRRIRTEQKNLELTSDDVWPEGQCPFAAIPGSFGCNFHGGVKALEATGRSVSLGVLPLDLQQKIEILQRNPDYISREMQIWEIIGMNAQLREKEAELGGGPETYDAVLWGLSMIEEGQIELGLKAIKEAMLAEKAQREVRDEIRTNIKMLADLTKVQVSTAKELKTMATTDQVMALVEGIVDDFIQIVKDVVGDKTIADRLVDRFVRAVKLRLNARIAPKMEQEAVSGGD